MSSVLVLTAVGAIEFMPLSSSALKVERIWSISSPSTSSDRSSSFMVKIQRLGDLEASGVLAVIAAR